MQRDFALIPEIIQSKSANTPAVLQEAMEQFKRR